MSDFLWKLKSLYLGLFYCNNAHNQKYYQAWEVEALLHGKLKDMDSYPDLKLISSYIAEAQHILEVGAGMGRVVDYIVQYNPQAHIYALEIDPHLCQELKMKYKNNNVHLVHADVQHYTPTIQFDLILYMWSGLMDHNKHEQIALLKKMLTWLSPEGMIILDNSDRKGKGTLLDPENRYSIISGSAAIYVGYIPSDVDYISYWKKMNAHHVKRIKYQTETGYHRSLDVLTKQAIAPSKSGE